MLLTGLLGRAGHEWAHAGIGGQRAWAEAMVAEQAWLAGAGPADDQAQAAVEISAAGQGHSPGDGPDALPEGLATDHAHSIVFLMRPGPAPGLGGEPSASLRAVPVHVPVATFDSPDHPPRNA